MPDKFVHDVVTLIMTNKLFVVIFLFRLLFSKELVTYLDLNNSCRAALDHKAAPISVGPELLKMLVSLYS